MYSKGRSGRPDFMNFNIDVDTVVRYMTMTQKKAPVDNIDKLIESGDIPAIIAKYVELTLQTNKIKEHLAANPDIADALSSLVPGKAVPMQAAAIPMWDRMGGTPPATMQLQDSPSAIIPGVAEPLGTIHKDVPVTYDYPMDEYTQGAAQSQENVKGILQAYQGIDPNGDPL